MKTLIYSIAFLNEKDTEFFYNWHKRYSDIKLLSNKKVYNENTEFIDIHDQIFYSQFSRLWVKALKYDYDYYIFLEHDTFILNNNFIKNCIEYMINNNIDMLLPRLTDKQEHYKMLSYSLAQKKYNIETKDIKWSILSCVVMSKKALNLWNIHTNGLINHEVDIYCCLENKIKIEQNKYINTKVFTPSNILKTMQRNQYNLDYIIKNNDIIHAVKDYDLLRGYYGVSITR